MIEISQALDQIKQNCPVLPAHVVNLDQAVGHVLSQSIASDVDSPPFDKSMMDGFAVMADDLRRAPTQLQVIDRVFAGSASQHTLHSGQAIQIMTGAPIPGGADAVVMIEQTSLSDSGDQPIVTIDCAECRVGQNILRRGLTMQRGEVVMRRGAIVRPEDIGLLCEAGSATCQVFRRPSLAVIATGDELIDVRQKPQGSQIRNSNGPMIASLSKPLCCDVVDLGIGADARHDLLEKINRGLEHDVLVLSGGVSAGAADLVPDLLAEAGVANVFHKVKIKPGKPIWFGTLDRPGTNRTLVFGLPGNPVSSLVCFHVFVAPALRQLAGHPAALSTVPARLTQNFGQRAGRTTYWPSQLDSQHDGAAVTPLDWKGSADLKTLAAANSFAIFDGQKAAFAVGEKIEVLPIR